MLEIITLTLKIGLKLYENYQYLISIKKNKEQFDYFYLVYTL